MKIVWIPCNFFCWNSQQRREKTFTESCVFRMEIFEYRAEGCEHKINSNYWSAFFVDNWIWAFFFSISDCEMEENVWFWVSGDFFFFILDRNVIVRFRHWLLLPIEDKELKKTFSETSRYLVYHWIHIFGSTKILFAFQNSFWVLGVEVKNNKIYF